MKKNKQGPWLILLILIAAMGIGSWMGTEKGIGEISFYSLIDLGGKIFLNALMLLVVPLVSSSIISGIAKIAEDHSFKRLGWKTVGFFLGTNFLAICCGFFVFVLFKENLLHSLMGLDRQVSSTFLMETPLSFGSFLVQIIPSNIVEALAKNHMVGVIIFSLLFGYGISKIPSVTARTLLKDFWEGVFQVMIVLTHIIMKFLPLGVFCLVARQFAVTGIESLRSLGLFFVVVIFAFFVYGGIVLPTLLKGIGRVSPLRIFKIMASAIFTAFSTSSSSATLPITMDCIEKKVGVSSRICSFVIPLGSSLNMAGSAIYAYLAALFIALAYQGEVSVSSQLIALSITFIASIGVAGIPSASLMTILVVLKGLGLPGESMALIFAVDRILDMFRTAVNVFSDSCCAILIACSEGEKVLEDK